MKVGLIGAGLQGRRRGPAVKLFPGTELAIVATAHLERAKSLADAMGCEATDNWRVVVEREDIDAVIVATPPHLHAPISIAAMSKGKHVLCEKPLARTLEEAKEMLAAAQNSGVTLKCGFNHRHHPAIRQAWEWVQKGVIGEPNFIRCRYGICGRPGYEKEWRANPEIVSGGQLMEQGIHAIDLFRWFMGNFAEVFGFTATYFWKMAPLEDNAFTFLRTERGQVASLHSSLTQWKNLFSFEIFGQDGYITVEGLGGSYSIERASLGRKDFVKPFEENIIEFRGEDRSWYEEWKEFITAVRENRQPLGDGRDGFEAMRLVFAIYESARQRCLVKLK